MNPGRMSRPGLKVLATRDIKGAVEALATDLPGAMERHEFLSEDEANDLLDLLKEVRIAATWEDD